LGIVCEIGIVQMSFVILLVILIVIHSGAVDYEYD